MTVLEAFAPLALAADWDAVGLQVGDPTRPCARIGIGLDVIASTLEEALTANVDLIVSHHPLFLRPTKSIRFDQPQGHLIQQLCTHQVSVYAMHTNLDATRGGLNDFLADQIGLKNRRSLLPAPQGLPQEFEGAGLGRIGELKTPETLHALATRLQTRFQSQALRIIGKRQRELRSLALCTGSGGSLVHNAITSGVDGYITGDVKYHQALDAEAAGLAIIDIGHYASEIVCLEILSKVLRDGFGNSISIIPLTRAQDPLQAL